MTEPRSIPKPISEGTALADFPLMYGENFGWMIHTLRRLGIASAELEDLAHDAFVAIYRHLDDLDPTRPLRPWLFGFAFRVASDHRKLSRHRHEIAAGPAGSADELGEPVDQASLPDQQLDDRRLRHRLQAALDAMDFEKRSLIVMHDLEAVPVTQIAVLLAVPLNTAYSRLRLARAEFEKQLQKLTGGTGV